MAESKFLALMDQNRDKLCAMLPADDERARDRWWAISYELTHNPDLASAANQYPLEMLNCVETLARWGLIPDGEEAFINIYGGHPEAEPMYQGMIKRAVEAGAISHCTADVIRAGDTIEEEIGRHGRILRHKRLWTEDDKERPLVGAYAVFWLPDGLTDYELFELSDIKRVEEAALRNARRRKKDAELSPAWRFSRGQMSKKSVLKRGLKRFKGRRERGELAVRYDAMVAAPTRFDAETTATLAPPITPEIEGSDDTPKGRKPPKPVNEPPKGNTLRLEPDPPKEDRKLTQDEMDEIFTAYLGRLKMSQIKPVIFKATGHEDLSDVMLSQRPKLEKALEDAAIGSDLASAGDQQGG